MTVGDTLVLAMALLSLTVNLVVHVVVPLLERRAERRRRAEREGLAAALRTLRDSLSAASDPSGRALRAAALGIRDVRTER